MLVDFYLAELSLKENAQNRETVLKRSRTLYNRFLSLCDTYDLLSTTDKSAFEKGAVSSSPADPATRRNEKIAKYKAEKELKAKIEVTLLIVIQCWSGIADVEYSNSHKTLTILMKLMSEPFTLPQSHCPL